MFGRDTGTSRVNWQLACCAARSSFRTRRPATTHSAAVVPGDHSAVTDDDLRIPLDDASRPRISRPAPPTPAGADQAVGR